ncbi:MAG: BACON domain-containing protein, partial [Dysgonamonadaceae bacterium]|nr:BACON domain-containing protein [Dysgonamonadaceae bacterium]
IIDNSELTQQVYADQTTATGGVSFTTKGAWTSTITEKPAAAQSSQRRANSATADAPLWISIDPDHGDAAGDYTINIVLEANTTGADRTAIITIRCGETEISITVTQRTTTETGEQPETPRLITQIASSTVINYDIAGEVRISGADGEQETTTRGILNSNGTVKTIKWQNSDEQYISNMAYNAEDYLSDYDDNNYPFYEGCNAYRYQWNSGNFAAVTHKNCTTNDKTNLDMNVLCFDIFSYSILDNVRIYQYPSMFFALSGNTGKRSKNYLLKVNDNLLTPEYPNSIDPTLRKPCTEATAPAIGSVLATYYDRAFDGNAVWQFDGQDF